MLYGLGATIMSNGGQYIYLVKTDDGGKLRAGSNSNPPEGSDHGPAQIFFETLDSCSVVLRVIQDEPSKEDDAGTEASQEWEVLGE